MGASRGEGRRSFLVPGIWARPGMTIVSRPGRLGPAHTPGMTIDSQTSGVGAGTPSRRALPPRPARPWGEGPSRLRSLRSLPDAVEGPPPRRGAPCSLPRSPRLRGGSPRHGRFAGGGTTIVSRARHLGPAGYDDRFSPRAPGPGPDAGDDHRFSCPAPGPGPDSGYDDRFSPRAPGPGPDAGYDDRFSPRAPGPGPDAGHDDRFSPRAPGPGPDAGHDDRFSNPDRAPAPHARPSRQGSTGRA